MGRPHGLFGVQQIFGEPFQHLLLQKDFIHYGALGAYRRCLRGLLSPKYLVARIAVLVPGSAVIAPLAARVGEG
jgi:hypothetical protein